MSHPWVRWIILTASSVVPVLALAGDAEPLPAPETLPFAAVVTPAELDAMSSVATPKPGTALTLSDAISPITIPAMLSRVKEAVTPTSTSRSIDDFWGYRTSEDAMSWTVGDGDQFGSFAFEPNPYLKSGIASGLEVGAGVQLLSGPQRTDMPAQVFEFSLGYQKRAVIGDLAYDVSVAILAASDFEGSSRDGIRFPAHAVGYYALTDNFSLAFGADYLDRGDIRLLPVGGLLLRPDPAIRIELVFPRPRVDFQLTSDYRLYFNGGLGGGTWAVERDSELDDLVSLYQLQVGVGLAKLDSEGSWGAFELVYLFDRKLEYAYGPGSYDIGPTIMLRVVTRK